jgi:uncharacterized protein YbbC (DUF1343 family)
MYSRILPFVLLILLFANNQLFYAQNSFKKVIPGAERVAVYKPMLNNKTIAVVANHTSMIGQTHLVDTLVSLGANIKVIFCPEHGFRGTEEAGKTIKNGIDSKTKLPVVSLYGKKVKPSADDLKGVDLIIYDLQDVGVRCYTYISTLYYVMQASAEHFVGLVVLDRPNPNGFYIDGPVLDMKYKSFVGVVPIPYVYGMTAGELATMINDEDWLPNKARCFVGVVQCLNYSHKTFYQLPIAPSPNLQNMEAVYLYPSLALFEGTAINVGRGTDWPFQVFGSPRFSDTTFSYKPVAKSNVMHGGLTCYGVDLRSLSIDSLRRNAIQLSYLKKAYKGYKLKDKFFNPFFENLSGTAELRKQIRAGLSEDSIRKTWQPGIENFKKIRKKYLLYEDIE